MPSVQRTSGLILAGGSSRRMGSDKAALRLGGRTLLDRTISVLESVADEVLVVGPRHHAPSASKVRLVQDDVPNAGPLGGLLTGLRRVNGSYAVTVACDLPFLEADVLRFLLELAPAYDAVVPRVDGQNQTLHAVYSRSIDTVIARHIARGQFSLDGVLPELNVRWVDVSELESAGLECRSFVNANTPEDWEAALRLAAKERPGEPNASDPSRRSKRK
jgi:molybdenum cofactor guanylyltransferase